MKKHRKFLALTIRGRSWDIKCVQNHNPAHHGNTAIRLPRQGWKFSVTIPDHVI